MDTHLGPASLLTEGKTPAEFQWKQDWVHKKLCSSTGQKPVISNLPNWSSPLKTNFAKRYWTSAACNSAAGMLRDRFHQWRAWLPMVLSTLSHVAFHSAKWVYAQCYHYVLTCSSNSQHLWDTAKATFKKSAFCSWPPKSIPKRKRDSSDFQRCLKECWIHCHWNSAGLNEWIS